MLTLIFDVTLSGHHLEYLHHYYEGALQNDSEQYIFLVPENFKEVKDEYEWATADNIKFLFLSDQEIDATKSPNVYVTGWRVSKLLNKYVRQIKPDNVLLTMLMQFVPFIIFLLPSWVRVRGIMYKIYLYEQQNLSAIKLLAEKIRFGLAARSKIIEKIFVLNDEDSANSFNILYHSNKFFFLPDPVPVVDMSQVRDLRKDLNISSNDTIYLHFGGLDKRKGTLDILNLLITADDKYLVGKTFVFAGKVKANLKDEFYSLLEKAQQKTRVFVFDEFCSYNFLYNLCYTSDIILMPYHFSNLSSGVLGYAAVFGKPVIGPNKGLLGRLIKDFILGLCIEIPIEHECFLQEVVNERSKYALYVEKNDLKIFIRTLLK